MADEFGPMLTITSTDDAGGSASGGGSASAGGGPKDRERLEQENSQLLREVLLCRRNLDIAQTNIGTLKALSNQLAQQLSSANGEIDLLRQRRDAEDLHNASAKEAEILALRRSYDERLQALQRELEEQLEINMQLGKESQDAHRKADKSFKDIIANKDELIAELTRTVECLQAGLRAGGGGGGGAGGSSAARGRASAHHGGGVSGGGGGGPTTLSSPARRIIGGSGASSGGGSGARGANSRSNSRLGGSGGGGARSDFDVASIRNQIIEPTADLLRLNLSVMKDDVAMRHTPLGDVNAAFHTSSRQPVTRYFVDVRADKHRLDEVPTVDLRLSAAASQHPHAGGGGGAAAASPPAYAGGYPVSSSKHYSVPEWPRSWKFHTPQGELITLSLDISSL